MIETDEDDRTASKLAVDEAYAMIRSMLEDLEPAHEKMSRAVLIVDVWEQGDATDAQRDEFFELTGNLTDKLGDVQANATAAIVALCVACNLKAEGL